MGPKSTLGEIFTGQVSAAKYQSGNPISRALVHGFLREIMDLVAVTGASQAHEVGCGEGQITGLLAQRGLVVRGSDLYVEDLAVARVEAARVGLDIEYYRRSVYELDPATDAAELVLCCEVLEHLTDPEAALRKLVGIAKKHLIVSVPREPLWRVLNICRMKYLNSLGNTPGHLNHWSTMKFVRLVEKFLVIEQVRTPVPWTVICGRPRASA
jgi:2-polyprenyl-3-methyl-5-hydroxy-6-metoxy-1,4-benzoquinol methylase